MKHQDLSAHKAICDSILPSIIPDNESLKAFVISIQHAITTSIAELGIKASCDVGGSFAKGTNLKGDFDIDMFVAFDMSYPDNELSGLLEHIVMHIKENTSLISSVEHIHGSRDYFDVTIDNYSIELVPVFGISSPDQVINVTDMSPLHVHWVREKMGERDLHNDVRLAKMFCKAAGVYGSESYIQGLSGHVLEILIIHYGGFLELLTNACEWSEPVVIDTMNYYSGTQDILTSLNDAKLKSPLIVIDPIDKNRNAAAAVHQNKFNSFIAHARSFLAKPDYSFFSIRPFDVQSIEEDVRQTYATSLPLRFITAQVSALPGNTDRAGAKMKKAYHFLSDELKRHDFTVLESGWDFQKDKKTGTFYYVLSKEPISPTLIREGPPLRAQRNAETFKKKYESDPSAKLYQEGERYHVILPRPYRYPLPLLQDTIQTRHITSLVRSIEIHERILEK